MRSAIPVASAYFLATAWVSGLMSQVMTLPPGSSAAAIELAPNPVNVPISSTVRARLSHTRNSRNRPSNGPVIIPATRPIAFVSSTSAANSAVGGLVWARA